MDNQLGFGAFKFQNAVQNQIRSSRDLNSSGKRSQIKIDHRLSLIEKSKQQLKPTRQQNQPPALFITNKIRHEYVLHISSSSSSSPSENESERDQRIEATQLVKKLKLAMGSFTPQPSPPKREPLNRSLPKTLQRREITFLRGLSQNQELQNCNTLTLEEYKVDRQIFVDIDSSEIMTFLRLQHEVEEMRRKQFDFQHQKERHFDYNKNKKPIDEKKEDFWTVLMAKRTAKKLIKNMNLKRLKPDNNITAHPQ